MNSDSQTTVPRQNLLTKLAPVILPTLGLWVLGVVMFPFDFWLSANLSGNNLPGDLVRCIELSEFFAHGFGIFVVLSAVWVFDPARRFDVCRIVVAILLTSIAVHLIKNSAIRLRPLVLQDQGFLLESTFFFDSNSPVVNRVRNHQIDSDLQSFPSGHSAAVTALAIGLCYLYPQGRWLFLTMAVLGCFQRIAFLAHWPSDVLFGAGIGYFLSSVVMIYSPRKKTALSRSSSSP